MFKRLHHYYSATAVQASLTVHSIHIDVQLALHCPVTADTCSHTSPWRSSDQCRPTHRCRQLSLHADSSDHGDVVSAPALSPPDLTDELSVQQSNSHESTLYNCRSSGVFHGGRQGTCHAPSVLTNFNKFSYAILMQYALGHANSVISHFRFL